MGHQLSAVIVIPTRNRASLAQTAAKSVLAEKSLDLSVIISDNSTEEDQSAALRHFCDTCEDARLHYVRPPAEMSMTDHWDWVMVEILSRFPNASHVTYLTDRTVFKPGGLRDILEVAAKYPDSVISHTTDVVDDETLPARVIQEPWTGKVFLLNSQFILWQNSRCEFRYYMPRMLNCMVPRTVMEALKDRFGGYFASIAPDHNFCYRLLYLADSIIYYDKAIHINYARNRSNGMSQQRGVPNKDNRDFNASMPNGKLLLDLAPIPEITGTGNVNIYEYRFVQIETGSPKLPAIDMPKYLDRMAYEMRFLKNPEARAACERLLREHGWHPAERPSNSITGLEQCDDSSRLPVGARAIGRALIEKAINLVPPPGLVPAFKLLPASLGAGRWWFWQSDRALEWALRLDRPRDDRNIYLEDSESANEFIRQCPGSITVIPGPESSSNKEKVGV